jgi:hypothetical protein
LQLPPTCADGWEHVGVDLVLERPADHVACSTEGFTPDFWIDRETRLVVRTQSRPDADDATAIEEVVELTFEEQPVELFELPAGTELLPTQR